MIGILIQLAITWLIAWLFEKNDLSVLGLRLTKFRVRYFFYLFFTTSFFCAAAFGLKMWLGHQAWQLNAALTVQTVANGIWWNIKSVLFEELIFRGVLLYILIKKFNTTIAVVISAIAFGVYHWFSFGVFGNPVQMALTFFITGSMGLLLAYGYAKTGSLYIPAAIHFGWNFTQLFIFSEGPIGKGLLIPVTYQPFRTNSYLIYFIVTLLPLLLALLTNFLILKKIKQPALLHQYK